MPLPDHWRPLVAEPLAAGLFVDFDGTLSAIVEDPASAVPVPTVVRLLEDMAESLGEVAIVSGRPLDFLDRVFGPAVDIVALYGLEVRLGGRRADHPQSGTWREAVADVAAAAADRGPEGIMVEPKGMSLTLHYRQAPEAESAVREFAAAQSGRSGLVIRDAKMSIELHPPIDVDKGSALRELAAHLDVVAYVGDDRGDLPAFDVLDELEADGVMVVRGAVEGEGAPADLLGRADVRFDSPEAVAESLGSLASVLRADR